MPGLFVVALVIGLTIILRWIIDAIAEWSDR